MCYCCLLLSHCTCSDRPVAWGWLQQCHRTSQVHLSHLSPALDTISHCHISPSSHRESDSSCDPLVSAGSQSESGGASFDPLLSPFVLVYRPLQLLHSAPEPPWPTGPSLTAPSTGSFGHTWGNSSLSFFQPFLPHQKPQVLGGACFALYLSMWPQSLGCPPCHLPSFCEDFSVQLCLSPFWFLPSFSGLFSASSSLPTFPPFL